MGSKNSKEKEKDTEFTGPMGVMHDKYGSAATHQCHEGSLNKLLLVLIK